MAHTTVLLHETIDGLAIQPGAVIVDATINGGGHSEEILKRWGSLVSIIGIDLDKDALARAKARLEPLGGNITLAQNNFRNLDEVIRAQEVPRVQGIIMDLGWSSSHVEESGRGFSFQKDEPLLMTYDAHPSPEVLTAYEIVNQWPEKRLADLFWELAEERFSRQIAAGIVEERRKQAIDTTADLVNAIEKALPFAARKGKIHLATKVFQALRMAVNDELGALVEAISKAETVLSGGGRLAIITFHSIEDRVVKQMFKKMAESGSIRLINKKVIVPARAEQIANRRARSAKLRIIEKI